MQRLMIESVIDTGRSANIGTVSFNCNSCGKCCNSAPLMSIPELFYHENLFVGCLAVRRVTRQKEGDTLISAGIHYSVSAHDALQIQKMAELQLCNSDDKVFGTYDFSIMTQAMDYESLNKCPALGEAGQCGIHFDQKPSVCSMVPFDSLYPNSLQNIVVMSRQFEENCIVAGERDGYQVVINNKEVVSSHYSHILKQRRDDLALEKHWWGKAVFSMLQNEFFSQPDAVAKIPLDNGLLSLSIIPVLMVLAGASKKCNARCLQYVDSQLALLDNKISLALIRKSVADKETTKEFRSFKDNYIKFRYQLIADQQKKQFFVSSLEPEEWVKDLEAYLGV